MTGTSITRHCKLQWSHLLLWVVLSAVLIAQPTARAELASSVQVVPVPTLTGRVVDLSGILRREQQVQLQQRLQRLEAEKGSQIVVLIVPSTYPESIEQFSLRVVEQWRLGRKKVDDGVLVVVATQDRTMRIDVGYGLEGAIPDAVAKRVIAEVITPYFRRGDMVGGLDAGISQLARLIDGESLPAPEHRDDGWNGIEHFIPFAFILIFVLADAFRALFGPIVGAVVAGSIVGGLIWLLVGSLFGSLVAGFIAFMFVLGGGGPGRRGRGGGGDFWILPRSGGYYDSGPFDGGGLGRGSDDFGGGGGGFGGGGASGQW